MHPRSAKDQARLKALTMVSLEFHLNETRDFNDIVSDFVKKK